MKISDYKIVGFSGDRRYVPDEVFSVCQKLENDVSVAVGCAKGVDEAFCHHTQSIKSSIAISDKLPL